MTISLYSKDWLESIVVTRLSDDSVLKYLDYTAEDCRKLLDNTSYLTFYTKVDTTTLVIKAQGDKNIFIVYSKGGIILLKDKVTVGEAFMSIREDINDNHLLSSYAATVCKGIDELVRLIKDKEKPPKLATPEEKLLAAKRDFNNELVISLNNCMPISTMHFHLDDDYNIYQKRTTDNLPVRCKIAHDLEDGTVVVHLGMDSAFLDNEFGFKSKLGIKLLKLCKQYHVALFDSAISNETQSK